VISVQVATDLDCSQLSAAAKRNPDALWQKILSYAQAGYLMGAGSNPGDDGAADEKGIVPVRYSTKHQIRRV